MTGFFLTFEGGDASGKTTQIQLLKDWLISQGHDVLQTREPGGTELGKEIRELLLHRPEDMAAKAEALLYAADRAHHIAKVVRPAISDGKFVLQDRYIDSSVAYQGAGRVLDSQEIRDLSLWATDDLLPDLTILLDLEPELARQRLTAADGVYDRLEAEADDFHGRVREQYLNLAANDPTRFVIISANQSVENIAKQIQQAVLSRLNS